MSVLFPNIRDLLLEKNFVRDHINFSITQMRDFSIHQYTFLTPA